MFSRRQFSKLFVAGVGALAAPGAGLLCIADSIEAEPQEALDQSVRGNGEQSRIPWLATAAETGIRFLTCSYKGSKLAAMRSFTNGVAEMPSGRWVCEVDESLPKLSATFRLVEGVADSAGVAIAFDFFDWSRDNYVLVPAVVYDGNRFHALGGQYAPQYPPEMYFNPELPLTIANNPRLSIDRGKASRIELLTGNAATPAICFYAPAKRQAFILLTEQKSRFGNHGLIIEENSAQDKITLVVSAPGVREKAADFGGFRDSGDEGVKWKAGDSLTLNFRLYSFAADSIPVLLDQFMRVRKELTGENHPRNLVPMSKMSDAILPRFKKRWVTVPAGSYFACENSRDLQVGWVSGFMQTPLLAVGDPTDRDHICEQIDFVIGRLQSKKGYFYAGITADGQFRADRGIDSKLIVLTRKNGDVLLSFFKFFQILKDQGYGDRIKPAWEAAARRLADAFLNTWNKSGEFGQYLDADSGEIAVYNSTGGAIVPAGLALASRYFNDPEFLRVAQESAEFYFKRDVSGLGLTSGPTGDTAQDPNSESTFGFLESIMALYWATGDDVWLERGRTVANLAATWTLSYDYEFPPQSQIAQLGGHMVGAVFASAQNKHAAPGICTSSGDYLLKLYRATGDLRYAELIRDIQHAHTEATDMPGHRTCGMGDGACMERIQPTDAEGKNAIGNFIHTENAWTELAGWMMVTELPGIYLLTDADRFFVFDHVEASVVERRADRVNILVRNPTQYPARVAIFSESAAQSRHPLAYTAYLRWPRIDLAPGQTGIWHVSTTGHLNPIPQKGITLLCRVSHTMTNRMSAFVKQPLKGCGFDTDINKSPS